MIVCDLDGVFADFVGAACKVHGREDYEVTKWNFFKDWGMDSLEEFWAPIDALGEEFYRELVQPYPWALDVLFLLDRNPSPWVIMTAVNDNPVGYSSKAIWVNKYLRPFMAEHTPLIVGNEKHLLANEHTLLIDDRDTNIATFKEFGGYTYTFPQPWNRNCRYRQPGELGGLALVLRDWAFRYTLEEELS